MRKQNDVRLIFLYIYTYKYKNSNHTVDDSTLY